MTTNKCACGAPAVYKRKWCDRCYKRYTRQQVEEAQKALHASQQREIRDCFFMIESGRVDLNRIMRCLESMIDERENKDFMNLCRVHFYDD